MPEVAATSNPTGGFISGDSTGAAPVPSDHGIDVNQLADRVYHLMLADARLGRSRMDSPTQLRRGPETL